MSAISSSTKRDIVINSRLLDDLTIDGKVIPREWIELGQELGIGHFGCVYEALLKNPEKEGGRVAVKTLRNQIIFSNQEVDMFIREALTMKGFDHPHVLQFLGLSFEGTSPMMILEFMENGCLLDYMRNENNYIIVSDLIDFALQIATGMEYLSNQRFIHRDLAARNCMLDGNMTVKVADFGLARDVYQEGFYTTHEATRLPIKWLAPECLCSQIFTTKSDVWSFGIVLWELMTRGDIPYGMMSNTCILGLLKDGERLPKPKVCPDGIYLIMQNCWAWKGDRRPTFTDILKCLTETVENIRDSHNTEVPLDHSYENVTASSESIS